METLKTIWDFFQNEVLGMNWLNRLIETFLNACGLDTTGKIGGSVQFFIYDICGNKTRTMIREDTELRNFPLYCPKCKKETSINAQDMKVTLAEHK